jgi:hypothetical protein
MSYIENYTKKKNTSSSSSSVSEISTQRLIEDGLTPSEYKSDYLEEREESNASKDNKNYKCGKCNSNFVNKQTLDIHQKTSSKCANSSNSDSSSSIDIKKKCQYCEKTFASKQMRLYHESKCMEKTTTELTKKYQNDIDILNDEIKSLKLELEKSKKSQSLF